LANQVAKLIVAWSESSTIDCGIVVAWRLGDRWFITANNGRWLQEQSRLALGVCLQRRLLIIPLNPDGTFFGSLAPHPHPEGHWR